MAKQNKRGTRKVIFSSLLLAISLLSMIISTKSLVGFPQKVGLAVLSFVQKGFDAVGNFFTDTVNSLAELKKLEQSHADLLLQLEQFGNLQREYADIKKENERLREQLGFDEETHYDSISARVIARDPENIYPTMILNKGSIHNVVKNQAVIAYQNGVEGLVGRVIEVSRTSCIVSPVYDISSYVAVRLERSRYEGLVSGSGSADFPLVLSYIRKRAKDEIQYGDLVVTSGMQSLYPAGISVGRITKIKSIEYLTSLEIEMEPVIDFGRLEYVFIVKNLQKAENND